MLVVLSCVMPSKTYVFVLAFSVLAFSIITKCVLLYLHFPYLCFPVLAISAPPIKLHDVWPSPELVHYIYIFGFSCRVTEFCQVQNSLCIQVLHSPILAVLLHGTRVVGISQTAACYKEWNYRTFAVGATYIWLGGCHVGHQPTF